MSKPKPLRKFAEGTKVSVQQTKHELESTLRRYGATAFAYYGDDQRAIIVFEANGRRIRFDLLLPKGKLDKDEREKRRLWRSLLLSIKAKLDSVVSNIESFEEAFLAHIVMPDGMTVGQHTSPRIASAYKGEVMQPLLPGPKK